MQQYPGYVDQPGLQQALGAAGIACWWEAGNFFVSDLTKAQAVVAAYDPLPAVQAQATAQVQATLASKLAAGFAIGSNVIAIDQTAQAEIGSLAILALATLAGQVTTPWPTGRTWPVVSGTPVPLTTPQDLIAVGAPCAHYVWSIKNYAVNLIAQIEAAITAAAVQAINITTGWPTS